MYASINIVYFGCMHQLILFWIRSIRLVFGKSVCLLNLPAKYSLIALVVLSINCKEEFAMKMCTDCEYKNIRLLIRL